METLKTGSTGPTVELLQSALKRTGIYTGAIDGSFGSQTNAAVMFFQQRAGLIADGIVGISTWNALYPYINGYDIHIVRSGDTLFNISNLYSASLNAIAAANPGINVYNLQAGQRITVPFGNAVTTGVSYTYDILVMNIQSLKTIYPFLETGYIGNSVLCRKIPYIRLGRGMTEVFYNASFHANEWITSPVLVKYAEEFLRAYVNNTEIYGYNARYISENISIYIVPMVNPDGVDLVTGSMQSDSVDYNDAKAIAAYFPAIPFPQGWKANIEGIDLNLQFPANWEQAREIKSAQGFTRPAPRDYVGSSPLTAPEASAVYKFTLAHDFRLILAYHTQGRVIFWQYLDYMPERAYYIGRQFSSSSGYILSETPYASSFAGYKDWFIQEYNRPGYTIEAGLGTNPLPISQFDTIYRENVGILTLGAVLSI